MIAKRTLGETIFGILNIAVLTALGFSMLFPFINVLAKSLSSSSAVASGTVFLLPKDIQFDTYKQVLQQGQLLMSFKNTVFITVVGTALSMIITVMTAYPLSKKYLKGRRFVMLLFVFSMLFGGGMIPNYLLMKTLGLLNNIWALILPPMMSTFNMIVIKTFLESLPKSVEESARVDGASSMRILFSIVLPMALPSIATIGLFYAVDYWNNYFSAVMYITEPALKPLPQYLYDLIADAVNPDSITAANVDQAMNATPEGIRCATIIVSTLPILCVYPFLQKYFVKGITIGSVKE